MIASFEPVPLSALMKPLVATCTSSSALAEALRNPMRRARGSRSAHTAPEGSGLPAGASGRREPHRRLDRHGQRDSREDQGGAIPTAASALRPEPPAAKGPRAADRPLATDTRLLHRPAAGTRSREAGKNRDSSLIRCLAASLTGGRGSSSRTATSGGLSLAITSLMAGRFRRLSRSGAPVVGRCRDGRPALERPPYRSSSRRPAS